MVVFASGDPHKDIDLINAEIEAIEDAQRWELIFKSGLEGAVENSERKIKSYYNIVQRKREEIKIIKDYIDETSKS